MAKLSRRGSSSIVPVGITQMACVEDPRENRARQAKLLEAAAKDGARILCTQEMFASQYFCQAEDHRFFSLAESIPGPSTDLFSKIARKHGVVIVASLFEKRASGLYHNTAAIIDADGSLMGIYRKMHIPTTRCTTRSSTSRRATRGSRAGRRATRRSACSSAGTSGSPRARA